MGFRFRRSIKIAPGVRINLSKSGVSTSIGVRGAHVTVGHGQVRETVGLPSSGISYTAISSTHSCERAGAESEPTNAGSLRIVWNLTCLALVFIAIAAMLYHAFT
jgi:Protein of unknown function (DUF4236)